MRGRGEARRHVLADAAGSSPIDQGHRHRGARYHLRPVKHRFRVNRRRYEWHFPSTPLSSGIEADVRKRASRPLTRLRVGPESIGSLCDSFSLGREGPTSVARNPKCNRQAQRTKVMLRPGPTRIARRPQSDRVLLLLLPVALEVGKGSAPALGVGMARGAPLRRRRRGAARAPPGGAARGAAITVCHWQSSHSGIPRRPAGGRAQPPSST